MGNVTKNIANNILKLRKINQMTQSDLAEILNYSDKAVSKWERGESVPDISTLCSIANYFKVDVNYLTKEHSDAEIEKTQFDKQLTLRNLLIAIMICIAIFLVATIIFVYTTINSPIFASKFWIVFIIATALCSLVVSLYAHSAKLWLVELIAVSLFVWGTLTTIFFVNAIIYYLSNAWMVFLVGIPLEAAVGIYYFWKRKI
ncbi:MAG: helix-turn-helix transcriptional regulator [Erysipelotrichia bacterium]|nr:helix-turn-helix transcriptional regulator [Erysipelotrichia bacterium]